MPPGEVSGCLTQKGTLQTLPTAGIAAANDEIRCITTETGKSPSKLQQHMYVLVGRAPIRNMLLKMESWFAKVDVSHEIKNYA